MTMLDDRPLIASQFRKLAEEYDGYSARTSMALDEEAGKLVMAAFHRGYLGDIPGLGELVEWVENPPPRPPGAEAMLCPCPSNLFGELCGNRLLLVHAHADGSLEIASDRTHGGILPAVFRDLLPGHKVGKRPEKTGSDRQRAAICRWLAAQVENAPQDLAEARDCWIYYEAKRGKTWKEIAKGVGKNTKWEPFTTGNGAKDAARRYAEKHGLMPIPSRPQGRPKNTK